ncbi:dethiobiotin synthase [Chthoniobacter flavus Ellin428]|uniref:ATP-dependent dethiobiotin synthetase BioD n=1 Tax=Chthoniobacter flavus Ellin428 TaxID=497964 RepID=B4D2A8_9BACT|nr:dethiobiotin synthase [Chthoniobacter flavus]EDY19348.1 dethiobiotin synthase [Chthoniobacter flavus Ellin428]TCO90521.1 dethiobiotin synthase [Chthoniobacter flavus]
MNLFLTGTDTNVGKSYIASLLVRALRSEGHDCVGLKPICCGDRDDATLLHAAAEGAIELNDVNPVWLRTPAAPYTASLIENRAIDLALIRESFQRARAAHESVIVEGAGGWLVPIERDYYIADLAVECGLPVAIVVANRLGALNHALLTVAAVRARGLECAGLILNHPSPDEDIATTTNRGVLEEFAGVPILFDVAYGQRGIKLNHH